MKWNKTPPPKDGTAFIGCCDYPWPCAMVYNPCDDDYAVSVVSAETFSDGLNVWFETESCKESEITAWMTMPEAEK